MRRLLVRFAVVALVVAPGAFIVSCEHLRERSDSCRAKARACPQHLAVCSDCGDGNVEAACVVSADEGEELRK